MSAPIACGVHAECRPDPPTSRPPRPAVRPKLSAREIEVMLAWLRSDTKENACQTLFIATGTLNTHLQRIRTKYKDIGRPASTKAALLVRALQDELITLDGW